MFLPKKNVSSTEVLNKQKTGGKFSSHLVVVVVFFFGPKYLESFGLILQNMNFICVIGTVESYLGLWGKIVNFGIIIAEIQQKVWERRRKRGERENVEFR